MTILSAHGLGIWNSHPSSPRKNEYLKENKGKGGHFTKLMQAGSQKTNVMRNNCHLCYILGGAGPVRGNAVHAKVIIKYTAKVNTVLYTRRPRTLLGAMRSMQSLISKTLLQ